MTRTALKMNPDLATLMHSALFSHLSRKAASTLAGSALLKTYLEGDVIFRQQEQAHFFCVVLRGYVRLTRTCDSGRIASLRICEPGDVFGECMLRAGPTYPYGAEAAENCVLAQFDLAAVRKLAEDDRSVDDAVMHVLSQNLLATLNCVAEDRLHTAPQRLAAYLGAVMGPEPNGLAGAGIALIGIFLPGLLLVYGMLPYWDALRLRPAAQAAMRGANAAVVGILGAALYNPVWTSAVLSPRDFALALAGFLLLTVWKSPPWIVVVLLAVAGLVFGGVLR